MKRLLLTITLFALVACDHPKERTMPDLPDVKTDFSFTCDGQAAEGGAYVQLYDSTTESFTTASAIPPQGAGYIELVCMVPTTWQQIGVTYTPTFVSGKTLNFTINASDLTKA